MLSRRIEPQSPSAGATSLTSQTDIEAGSRAVTEGFTSEGEPGSCSVLHDADSEFEVIPIDGERDLSGEEKGFPRSHLQG